MIDYKLRKLTSADIFPICTIIKKVGIDEIKNIVNSPELKQLIAESKGDDKATTLGMHFVLDVASLILGNLPKCESEIYKFLSSVAQTEETELRNISPADFLELIISVIKHEDFQDFFKVASQSLK